MSHEVFVSYSSVDKAVADSVVSMLEKNGMRCWYAPRDIKPGDDWGEAIAAAIEESEVFILIFSGSSNRSQRVLDELNLAISREVLILPFRIEKLDPSGAMLLHLSSRHWLDAYDPSWEKFLSQLVQTTTRNIERADELKEIQIEPVEKIRPAWIRKLAVGLGFAAVLAVLILVFGMDTLFPGGGFAWFNSEPDLAASQTAEIESTSSEASQIQATASETANPTSTFTHEPSPGSAENPLVWMYLPRENEEFTEVNDAASRLVDSFHEQYPDLNLKAMPAPDMAAAVDALCDGEIHIAFLDAISYLVVSERGCAEARLIWSAFSNIKFGSMVVVNSERGIEDLSELEGGTLCIPSYNSMSGWILPSLELKGIISDPAVFFKEIVEKGTHDDVILGVYNGECDAGTAYYDAREPLGIPDVMDKVEILETTIDVPFDNISFVSTIEPDVMKDLMDFYTASVEENDDLVIVAGYQGSSEVSLIEINDYYYNVFRDLFERAGENPEDYLLWQE